MLSNMLIMLLTGCNCQHQRSFCFAGLIRPCFVPACCHIAKACHAASPADALLPMMSSGSLYMRTEAPVELNEETG